MATLEVDRLAATLDGTLTLVFAGTLNRRCHNSFDLAWSQAVWEVVKSEATLATGQEHSPS